MFEGRIVWTAKRDNRRAGEPHARWRDPSRAPAAQPPLGYGLWRWPRTSTIATSSPSMLAASCTSLCRLVSCGQQDHGVTWATPIGDVLYDIKVISDRGFDAKTLENAMDLLIVAIAIHFFHLPSTPSPHWDMMPSRCDYSIGV